MTRTRLRVFGFIGVAMIIAACGSTATTGGGSSPTPTVKVGLVTDIGGLNDKSFNHLAAMGLAKASSSGSICSVGGITCGKSFAVQGDVVESHNGNDYVPNLTNFASKGYSLVIGVGFLMQTAIGTVSGQFPNIHFAIIDGAGTDSSFKDLKHANVESLLFKEQDAGAMVGVIAGMLEKQGKNKKNKGVISAVGGQKIPPVDHYIAGYQWAAQMEDPGIKVLVGYSNDFADPAKCKPIAQSQINQGSDVVFQVAGGCGLGALQAAGQAGVSSIGVDADQKDADASVIASALKKVDVATYTAIQQVVQGSFQSGATTFSIANDGAGYQLDNITLPADVQAELDKVQGEIKSGALTPPSVVS